MNYGLDDQSGGTSTDSNKVIQPEECLQYLQQLVKKVSVYTTMNPDFDPKQIAPAKPKMMTIGSFSQLGPGQTYHLDAPSRNRVPSRLRSETYEDTLNNISPSNLSQTQTYF